MANITSDTTRKAGESPRQGDSPLLTALRYGLLMFLDALALIIIYGLVFNQTYGLAATLAIATLVVNVVTFVPALYPLRWMAPGLFLVILLVIYPIFYTVYTSFTNFGDGHRLSKEKAAELILTRRDSLYIADDTITYSWLLFRQTDALEAEFDESQFALLLINETDDGIDYAFAPFNDEIVDVEFDAVPETYEGYTQLQRIQAVRFLGDTDGIGRTVFGTGDDTAQVLTSSQAARPLRSRYAYNEDTDTIVDQITGTIYQANDEVGSFEPTPTAYVYNDETGNLDVVGADVVIEPNEQGLFELPAGNFRYAADRDALVGTPTGGIYTENDEGQFVIESGDALVPGYRVWIGLDNFERFFTDPRLRGPLITVFIWTVMFAFLSVFTTFAAGLFMAIILNDATIPGKKLIRSLLIIPYAIPGVIGIVVWRGMIFPEQGVLWNAVFDFFSIRMDWLSNAIWARSMIIIVNLWLGYPYMMLICSGALQAIPSDIYEAAAVDGASQQDRFWQITLPLLLVTVGPLLIASFTYNFNNYLLIEALTQGAPPIPGTPTPAGYTDILISYTYRLAFGSGENSDFGYASAITIVIFFLVAAVTMFQFRFTRQWEEVGENV